MPISDGTADNRTAVTETPTAAPGHRASLRRRLQNFFQPFACVFITDPSDLTRYKEAAKLLLGSGIVAAVLTIVGVSLSPEKDLVDLFSQLAHHRFLAGICVLLWAISSFYPLRRKRLLHIEGSLSVLLSFTAVSILLCFVVLATGNLSRSAFSATFFIVLTISLFLPQTWAIRLAFFAVILIEAWRLTILDTDYSSHDWLMISLSVFTTFFFAIVRFIMDSLK